MSNKTGRPTRHAVLESLEDRRHFALSVTATQLYGPLTAGTKQSYNYIFNGISGGRSTTVVYGPAKLHGKSYVRSDSIFHIGGYVGTAVDYISANNTSGVQSGEIDSKTTDPTGLAYSTVTGYQPSTETLLPAKMVSGTTYKYTNARVNQASVLGQTFTQTYSIAQTYTLRSSTDRLSTRLGTMTTYVVDSSATYTLEGVTYKLKYTSYYAPKIGLVRQDMSSTSSTDPTPQSSVQYIISYVAK